MIKRSFCWWRQGFTFRLLGYETCITYKKVYLVYAFGNNVYFWHRSISDENVLVFKATQSG